MQKGPGYHDHGCDLAIEQISYMGIFGVLYTLNKFSRKFDTKRMHNFREFTSIAFLYIITLPKPCIYSILSIFLKSHFSHVVKLTNAVGRKPIFP